MTWTVMVGVDFDHASAVALEQAARLAQDTHAELHVCHCAGLPTDSNELNEVRLRAAQLRLAQWTGGHGVHGVQLHVALGKTAVVLAQLASALDVDLLVLGASRVGQAAQSLRARILARRGRSVLRDVLAAAPCSVMVAAPKQPLDAPFHYGAAQVTTGRPALRARPGDASSAHPGPASGG